MKILEIARQIHDRIPAEKIDPANYISTDNMKPWFGGYEPGTTVPSGTLTSYQTGDILLSNIRPYFRKTWLATHDGGCNADVLCIRANESQCVPEYLYYVFCTNGFVEDYLKGSKGAKMPRGDINRLLNYEIRLPEKADQLRIAGLLGSLDEKITICRKKIAELEALAKLVYERWFVEFEFPNADGRPYKSNGGKMVWNETLKRNVPEGWSVRILPEIADYLFGFPFDSAKFNSNGIGTSIVRIRNVKDGFTSDFTTEVAPDEYYINNGDFIIGMDGYFDMNLWIGGKAYLVQRSCRVTSKNPIHQGYLIRALYLPIKHLEQSLTGATLAHLGKAHLDRIPILLPPEDVPAFHLLNEIDARKIQAGIEIRRLSEFRDWLLPMLMNGQVEVRA